MTQKIRIAMVGAGAIGGYIAGHLARVARAEVSVVARGRTLAALHAAGLHITTPRETFSVAVNAVDDPRELGPQDYIFLTLKAHQVDSVLDTIAPLIGARTTVLPPTTGIPYYFFYGQQGAVADSRLTLLDPDDRHWRAMPPAQALGVAYWIGAHSPEPGHVVQDGERAACPVGEIDGSRSERVVCLSELLSDAGIYAPVRENIRGDIWVKFVNSLCWNPVAVLTLARLGEMTEARGVLPVVKAMMEEADAIGRQLGVDIPQVPDKRIAVTLGARAHKMSMLQDLEHGRPLELDVLTRSIDALRTLAAIPTPTVDTVLALAQLRARSVSHPI
ncbi:2-dehydropantoate 2-reductase [Burkholderia sp. Ax-1724]|uniref:ketopantoate reductase family protein n=1 Tax=Burkholderia sp. Ax-1724 TaxID=2608336 RepID=UPI001420AAE5|nr:2-dehydropantoate 2-reductase [Burkholderia sp. Ax-1724]NIF55143.1 2-dehydropantoate 2-reductase [Burkholderia sp. Ax-1724]